MAQKKVVGAEHSPVEWKKKRVDGYYQDKNGTKVAIEFLGDYYHGHPSMWSDGTGKNGVSFADLFAKTEKTLTKLAALGYRVQYVWEYDYKRLKGLRSVQSICREFNGTLEWE